MSENRFNVGPWIVQECGRGGTGHKEFKTECEAKDFAKAFCARRGLLVVVAQVKFIYERLAVTEHALGDEATNGNEERGEG